MATHKGKVELITPSLAEDPGFNFDTRPHKVEKWVAQLPLTNTGQTARLTFNTLVQLNRHAIPIKNRIKILEIFRPAVRYLLETTRKHFFGSAIPISEKSKTVAHLARSLQEEMANGYKIVIMDSLNPKKSPLDPKVQAMIAHRALYYLGGMLFTSYQIYMPPPTGVWRDIHQVFRFAEQFNLLHDTVNDVENDLNLWSTVLDMYKQIALFALADPYHLSQHEMEKLRTALSPWANTCQLSQYSDLPNQAGAMLIKPYDDLPPSRKIQQNENQTPQYRSLDTSGALHKIRKNLSQTNEKKVPEQKGQDHLPPSLLSHLSKAWNPTIKRRFARNNRKAILNVAFGLDAVHHFVNGNKNSFARDSNTNILDSLFHSTRFTVSDDMPEEMDKLDTIDVWELNHPHPIDTELDDETLASIGIEQAPRTISQNNPIYYTDRCMVMNESAGGLCIQLPQESPPLIHIGELLCLQNSQDPKDYWEVGVIRWIKNTKGQTIEVGVQLLSPAAEAVALSTYYNVDVELESENRDKDYVRGLLLPEIKALKQPRSLITLINCYQSGSIVSLLVDGIEQRYTLLAMIESTYGYNRFEVIPHISKQSNIESLSKNRSKAKEKEAFGEIWSTL